MFESNTILNKALSSVLSSAWSSLIIRKTCAAGNFQQRVLEEHRDHSICCEIQVYCVTAQGFGLLGQDCFVDCVSCKQPYDPCQILLTCTGILNIRASGLFRSACGMEYIHLALQPKHIDSPIQA